ncbi:MAG: hypothetical protein WCF57_20125 [Pyrinomonadaceae bacterium]
MKDRASRHLELMSRGIRDQARREAILQAEDVALRRQATSVFDLIKDDQEMRERLTRGPGAFKEHEVSLIAVVKP